MLVGPAQDDLELLTQLPNGLDTMTDEARRIVAAAGAESTIDQVLAIQDHFAGPDSSFVYSTDVPGLRGSTALEEFVLDTQVGYCEYYATAMAVMLRGLGVPTRVATGYLPGREIISPTDTQPGLYQVSSTDAHAWVEVAFEDFGWVTFDPTPRSDTAGLRPGRDALAGFGPNGGTAQGPLVVPSEDDLLRASEAPDVPVGAAGAAVPGSGQGAGLGAGGRVLLVGVALLVVLALAVGAWWWWARRRRTSDVAAERVMLAQSHLLVTAAALGRGRRPDETLHELVDRWIASGDVDGPTAQLLVREASLVAFGGDGVVVSDAQAQAVEDAVERLSLQLRLAAPRRDRMLAELRMLTIRASDA